MQFCYSTIRSRQGRIPFLPRLLAASLVTLAAVVGVAHAAPPRFDTATQRLSVPLVKIGERVYPDVEIELAGAGTWKVVKAGDGRPQQDGDAPGAELDPAANTFTVARLHVGGKVYDNLQLDLGATTWSLKGPPQPMSALIEDDFSSDAELEATLDNVVLLNLESSGASTDGADSGGSGTDGFPLRLQGGDYQFCFDKQDDGVDTLALRDEQGNLLLTLKSGDPCTQLSLAAGRYVSEVRYGGASGQAHPVFMRKQQAGGQGFAFDFGNAFIVAFGANCTQCNLSDALYLAFPGWRRDLSKSNMARIVFQDANLEEANLSNSLLQGALISRTNLKNANLSGVNMYSGSIQSSNLSGANLRGASFTNAVLANTDLSNADLRNASFSRAKLINLNLTGADLSGAQWPNRAPCAPGSIGYCK